MGRMVEHKGFGRQEHYSDSAVVKTLYIIYNCGSSLLSKERIDCGGISILCSRLEHCSDFLMIYIYILFL